MSRQSSTDVAFRLGAAVLATVAGAVIAAAIWLLGVAFQSQALTFGKLFLAGAASGLVSGLLFPHVAMELVETVAHFVFGAASAVVEEVPDRSPVSTPWLRMSFTFGVVYAVVLYILL